MEFRWLFIYAYINYLNKALVDIKVKVNIRKVGIKRIKSNIKRVNIVVAFKLEGGEAKILKSEKI